MKSAAFVLNFFQDSMIFNAKKQAFKILCDVNKSFVAPTVCWSFLGDVAAWYSSSRKGWGAVCVEASLAPVAGPH